ncbi:MAG: amidohydrolase [Planctomycetaceae bacterium]
MTEETNEPQAAGGPTSEQMQQLTTLTTRSQQIMSHAWMIRTFIKHCDEVEDFPELNEMARVIFDVFRAVETQLRDPVSYFRTLRKKLAKLRSAAEQFEKDAWKASTHTNFEQCSVAAKFLCVQLQEVLQAAEEIIPRPAPPQIRLPGQTD